MPDHQQTPKMEGHLTEEERSEIIELYENRFYEKGYDINTVGWSSFEDQVLRFEVLARGLNLTGKKIVDVGCGLADLVPFVDAKTGGNYSYVGIDIAEALLSYAREKYAAPKHQFISGDIMQLPKTDILIGDIYFLSGALNYKIGDNKKHAFSMISKMLELSSETVSFNMLTSYVDYTQSVHFHYSPEEIMSFAKNLSRWVNLYHDYPLYEFTVQISHQPFGS
jgi:ubiquinone/menaquinone biosynthesis C-methylase UbiE